MKKTFTLLLSSLFSLSLLAYNGNRLSISSSNYTMNLRVEVDGQQVMMQANMAILNNLSEGSHNLRIYREKNKAGSSGKYEIIYATSVYIGNAYQVDVAINQFGKVQVNSYSANQDDYWFYDSNDPATCSASNSTISKKDNADNYLTTSQEIAVVKNKICKQGSGIDNK